MARRHAFNGWALPWTPSATTPPARASWQAALTLYSTLGLPEAHQLRRLLEETPAAAE